MSASFDGGALFDALAELADLGAESLGSDEFAPAELPYDPTRPEHLQAGGNFRVSTRYGPLDVMQWVPGIEAEQAYAQLARDAMIRSFQARSGDD